MKISYCWLRDYVKTSLSPEEISEILTSIGLEVESLEKYCPITGGLEGFVVGEVLTCHKHPDADRDDRTDLPPNPTDAVTEQLPIPVTPHPRQYGDRV